MAQSVDDCTRRGAALLDAVRPGWEKEVNLSTLDIQTKRSCLLGQLYGWYFFGIEALRIDNDKAARLGFRTISGLDNGFDLTAAWHGLILGRLREATSRFKC